MMPPRHRCGPGAAYFVDDVNSAAFSHPAVWRLSPVVDADMMSRPAGGLARRGGRGQLPHCISEGIDWGSQLRGTIRH